MLNKLVYKTSSALNFRNYLFTMIKTIILFQLNDILEHRAGFGVLELSSSLDGYYQVSHPLRFVCVMLALFPSETVRSSAAVHCSNVSCFALLETAVHSQTAVPRYLRHDRSQRLSLLECRSVS